MKKLIASVAAVMVVAAATTLTADVDLKDVQCVVAKKAASADKAADYKDGKVYFCCGGCAGKFAKETEKYSAKANMQLVSTKQYEQKSCPMSGRDLNPEMTSMLGKTKVGFCCGGCKGKFDKAEDDAAKMALVFNNKAFDKAFAKAEKK